jgi:hypothetical protein
MKLRMVYVPVLTAIAVTGGLMAASPAGASLRMPTTTSAMATAPVIVRPTPWRVVYTNRTGRPILRAIAALSRRDIWAIGDRRTGPFSVHWNGQRWTTATIRHAVGFTPQFISAPSAADIWVLGYLRDGNPSALQWDGASWHSVALPADGSDLGVVFSPSDIWLVGNQTTCVQGCVTSVLHWNGSVWKSSSVPTTIAGIGGTSDGNLWLLGQNNIHDVGHQERSELVSFRWSGSAWRPVSMPHPEIAATPGLTVQSARNVWIDALRAKPRPNGEQPTIGVHWNGQRWTVLTVPDSLAPPGVTATDGGQGLWFQPELHWTGTQWIAEVGRWLPSWANPWAYVGISHAPGTHAVVVVVQSPGGSLIGANQPLG